MIKSINIKRYLLLMTLSLNLFSLFGQVTIKGSLWENGNESECNWYFKDHLACMEMISNQTDGTKIQTRLVMNANTQQLTIVSSTSSGTNYLTLSADSIRSSQTAPVRFIEVNEQRNFEGFGSCKKIQAKSHTQESLLYYFENAKINLSLFTDFLKGDACFEWLSTNTSNGFPVQSITVDPLGNLKRSFLATSIDYSVNDSVFGVICH